MKSTSRGRSLLRTLADAAVFAGLLAMVLLSLKQWGWLAEDSGRFIATDGDSLRKGTVEYRLHAIDAPELHQKCTSARGDSYPCGREALNALKALVTGRELSCGVIETDRYGRLVALCKAGTDDIAAAMVRTGWAIAYRRHGTAYVAAEMEAKSRRLGIWQGPFDRPEDWRSAKRKAIVQGSMADTVEPD